MAQATTVDLQHLLLRMYRTGASNEEKAAIDRELDELRRTTFTWRVCIMELERMNDHYVWFYMAATVERTINCDWTSLPEQDHLQIRHMLVNLYSNLSVTAPALQRNKIAGMIARIAFRQPDQFGEFVQYVQGVLGQKFMLGLGLVWAISDIVLATRGMHETSSLQRTFIEKAKAHAHPLLRAINEYCALFVTMLQGAVPEQLPGVISVASYEQNVTAIMDALQQCFIWIRLADVDASIVSNIAFLARGATTIRDGAIGAMNTLTELLYRNETLIPDAGRQLAIAVYEILDYAREEELDDLYHDKVCELMRLYIKRGWPFENPTGDITVERLLAKLLEYTENATTAHTLMDRFNVWTYVCGLHYGDDSDANVNGAIRPAIGPPFARALIGRLLRSMFFRTYRDLTQLDNKDLDEHENSERDRFLTMCIDLIMLLIGVFPIEMYEETLGWLVADTESPYRQGMNAFHKLVEQPMHLCQLLDPIQTLPDYLTASKLLMRMCSSRYGQSETLNAAVQQVTDEQIQLFVRFTNGVTRPRQLCNALKEVHRFDLSPLYAQLLRDIKQYMQFGPPRDDRVGQQGAVTLSTTVTTEAKAMVLMFLPFFLLNDTSVCWRDEWKPVADGAVTLLQFYVQNRLLGPVSTSEQVFQTLARAGIIDQKLHHLDARTAGQLQCVVCQCLLDLVEHDRARGLPSINHYLSFLASTVLQFPPAAVWTCLPPNEQRRTLLQQTGELVQLTTLLKCVETAFSGGKRVAMAASLYRIVGEVLGTCRSAIPATTWAAADAASCGLISALLDFCYTVVCVLHSQLDPRVMQDVLELLHSVFTAEETQGFHRFRSATTMLQTLCQMMKQPQNRTIMPAIVRVVLCEVLPIVGSDELYQQAMSGNNNNNNNNAANNNNNNNNNRQEGEECSYETACVELFRLLHDMLHHRWQFFVDTSPMQRMEPGSRTIVQPEAFVTIMNAYEHVLTTNHGFPTVVKQVLSSLETLGTLRLLFIVPLFFDQLMEGFMQSLLRLAISDHGAIHQEQIVKVLHAMAQVEPVKLNVVICAQGIRCDVNILQLLQRADDLPSFRMLLNEILNNAR
uniref:Importin N-terminal domain-containing protein n=1 Tax=Anopheles dirus TaxID=7168 RepID=A0A182N0J8_9DIPT